MLSFLSQVYANDLNPESAKYLNLNIQLNKVSDRVLPFNMDGRQFVRLLLATPGGPVQQLNPPEAAEVAVVGEQPEVGAAPQQQQHAAQPQQQQKKPPTIAASAQQQQPRPQKRKLVAEVPPAVPPGFRPPPGGLVFQHAVMNLPASAVEFLDVFHGAFDPVTWRGRLPLVHVYTFMKNETEEGELLGAVCCLHS